MNFNAKTSDELFWTKAQKVFGPYLREQKKQFAGIIVALLVMAVANGAVILMMKGLLKVLFSSKEHPVREWSELFPASAAKILTSQGFKIPQQLDLAWLVPVLIAAAIAMRALANYVYQLNQQAIALHVARRFRDRIFHDLLARSYLELKARSPAAWMSSIMNDVMFLQGRLTDVLASVLRDGVVVVSALVVLTWLHWPTALVVALVAPFIARGMGQTGRRIAHYAEAVQRELAKIAAAFLDFRSRFDFIRAQHGEKAEFERFNRTNDAYFRMIVRSIFMRAAFAPALEFVGFSMFAIFVWALGRNLWASGLTTDLVVQVLVALGLMLKPLKEIGEQFARLAETKGALRTSLDIVRDIHFLPHLDPPPSRKGALGKIDIKSIRIGYNGSEILKAQDLALEPGKAVALIGPSGAGKSSFLKVFAGLLEPSEWICSHALTDLQNDSSLVSQEPFLFDDTIINNLLYGSIGSEASEAGIFQALSDAGVANEMAQMPDGLNTHVRALSSNLSGGQIQRLVIARAFLRGRSILLLDEATSALDGEREKLIFQTVIDRARQEGTYILAVTHRMQQLSLFDEVWFFEDGEVRFKGSPSKLQSDQRFAQFRQESER